jgi:hypothetical protein
MVTLDKIPASAVRRDSAIMARLPDISGAPRPVGPIEAAEATPVVYPLGASIPIGLWTLSGAMLITLAVVKLTAGLEFLLAPLWLFAAVKGWKWVIRPLLLIRVVHDGSLRMREGAFLPGDLIETNYTQRVKRPEHVRSATLQLVCRESTHEGSGETAHWEHRESVAGSARCADSRYADVLEIPHTFMVPLNAQPSVSQDGFRRAWLLRVRVDLGNWPDYSNAYEIIVLTGTDDAGGEIPDGVVEDQWPPELRPEIPQSAREGMRVYWGKPE